MNDLAERLYRLEVEAGACPDESISVVCYLWRDDKFSDPRDFDPERVNRLAGAVKANLHRPHRFICVTDETDGFSLDVELMALPEDARPVADIPTAEMKTRMPSCYRRLWTFSESAKCLGDVVLMLDIDCFILGPLDTLFDYLPHADFVGWRAGGEWGTKIGGGTWRLRTGTRSHVWENFSQREAKRIRDLGFRGSDQAVLSCYLAEEPIFPDGWILNRQDMRSLGGKAPATAKIVHSNGPNYMKLERFEDVPWVK